MRKLFSRRPHPYYIYSYDYRRNSAGVRVLHMLCDALNRSGQEAYVVARNISPKLITPMLSDEVIEYHKAQGIKPVMVYPEVIDGNPLNGETVVRYLLNKPGFLKGTGEYEESDLLFAFKEALLQPGMPLDHVLYLPAIDLEVFKLSDDPSKREPGLVCFYQGREGAAHIDQALLPEGAIEITPNFPATWEELADIFQRCEYFYCGEASALAGEAVLCGCLTVIMASQHAPGTVGHLQNSGFGVAKDLSIEELAQARASMPKLREYQLRKQEEFWLALDRFIEITQRVAAENQVRPGRYELNRWLAKRLPTSVQNRLIGDYLQQHAGGPLIGLLILDLSGSSKKLAATIASLRLEKNLYATVNIVVLSVNDVPATSAQGKLHFIKIDAHEYVARLNQVVEQSSFDWIMLVNAGDEFTPAGLMMLALELVAAPDCRAVYGDELQRLPNGDLGGAFRPAFNLDMLLAFPTGMASHWLIRRDAFLELGGFDPEFDDALAFELLVRLIEKEGGQGIGHIDEPLLITDAPILRDNSQERLVIERHLAWRGYQGTVSAKLPGRYRINYGHQAQPLVSIIIPTKDQLPILTRCVESLLEKTRYQHYEVLIVDNNSETPEACDWLAQIESLGADKVRVLRYPHPFNFSAINNAAAAQARGEYLVLLNNDTAIIQEDWLDALLNHAQRPEVGIVGSKLLYPDGSIQHAGVILGLRGPADHPFLGEPIDAPGYMQRLQVDQGYSAVTAACLMIRKSIYDQLGGMDEEVFKVSYNDVDLCLKVREAGYLIVWTPYSIVMHEGSVSQTHVDTAAHAMKRKRFMAEQDAMYERWLSVLANDPAYNRNLALNGKGFELETDSNLTWRPLTWRPLPTVLAHPADPWGCGNYRVIRPFEALRREGLVDGMMSDGLLQVVDLARYDPDVVILQRQIGDERQEAMRRIKAFSRAFKVYELDDYLPNLPLKSLHREHMPKDILKSLRQGLRFVDRFVVSTQPLAEAFVGLHEDIRVVENRLPVEWWKGLSSRRRRGRKPRVGWAGGVSHTGDLDLIVDVVRELAGEVEWVFMGMCPDAIRPFINEFHGGVDIESYPAALASLDLDLALAPVEQNLFNECKSNLRLLEYGACGFPVICSDLVCYRGDLPVTRVKNRFRDWVDAIRMHISDLDATAQAGDRLREAVYRDWMLEGENLERWRRAWMPD